jgi:hypothetical protein
MHNQTMPAASAAAGLVAVAVADGVAAEVGAEVVAGVGAAVVAAGATVAVDGPLHAAGISAARTTSERIDVRMRKCSANEAPVVESAVKRAAAGATRRLAARPARSRGGTGADLGVD